MSPYRWISIKKKKNRREVRVDTVLTHLLAIETASKLVDNGRKIQNYDTYYCKPQLIAWR